MQSSKHKSESSGLGKATKRPMGQTKSRSKKANLHFPVGRIHRFLRGCHARRVGVGAAVYMAGVLEYMTAEILELAGNSARDHKRKRIIARDITLAIRTDDELEQILRHVTIAGGGVRQNIHEFLMPIKKAGKKDEKEGEVKETKDNVVKNPTIKPSIKE